MKTTTSENPIQTFWFGDKAARVLHYRGQPVWIAKEVGALLGYSGNGNRFVENIRAEWAEELVAGVDVVRVEGPELADLKQLLKQTGPATNAASGTASQLPPKSGGSQQLPPESGPGSELPPDFVGSRSRHLTLLTRSGLDLTCTLSKKPIGVRFRRWLVDDVLPKLRQDETVASPASPASPRPGPLDPREERLARRERRLLAKEARSWLAQMESRYELADDALQAVEVSMLEQLIDRPLPMLKPTVTEAWFTATDLATWFGVSRNRIGRVRTALGLVGNQDGLTTVRLGDREHSRGNVEQTLFSRGAAYLIGQQLVKDVHVSAPVFVRAIRDHQLAPPKDPQMSLPAVTSFHFGTGEPETPEA